MPINESALNLEELVRGLALSGLRAGDTVFLQLSLDLFGRVEDGAAREAPSRILTALVDLVGPAGTILVPAFTFSFEKGEEFDRENSVVASGMGEGAAELGSFALKFPGAMRSDDPLCSVVGVGPGARGLLSNLPYSSIGSNSLFDRLSRMPAKVCLIGVPLERAAFMPFAEDSADAPWQYKKLFTGLIREGKGSRRQGWIAPVTNEHFREQTEAIRKRVSAEVERGYGTAQLSGLPIMVAEFPSLVDSVRAEVVREAEAFTGTEIFDSREAPSIQLPQAATMSEMISALWRLPRDIVSDGYDAALSALASQVPMQVHAYPTGTECWTWLVPERWTCRDARLERLDGTVLFSYRDNPLHAVSYSLPFSGVVSRTELFGHLHIHPRLDDAIPFVFKYYERDWGLCCSKNLKDSLRDDEYRVVIDSVFSFGSLKVGECVVKGASDKTFVLCAHLCHPGMVNDDLSGVVVGIKVMQDLMKRTDLRYTYRFLILPETIGSVAYLSHNMRLVPQMVGGLFLEMLGLNNPHALQLSFNGDTEMDRCMSRVLQDSSPGAWIGAFRTVVGNDERQFNAPGVRVPMLSLSRVLRERSNGWPYFPEYHSSRDNPELAPEAQLVESRDLVLRMIQAIESSEVPVNLFEGEVFCSRYGIHIDPYLNPEGNRALFDILFLIDGTRSVTEIARICNISESATRSVLEELRVRGLIAYSPLPRD